MNLSDPIVTLEYLSALSSDYVAIDHWKSFIDSFSLSILDVMRVFSIDSIDAFLHNAPYEANNMATKLLADIFRHSVDALNLPMEVMKSMREILMKVEAGMKIKVTPKVFSMN